MNEKYEKDTNFFKNYSYKHMKEVINIILILSIYSVSKSLGFYRFFIEFCCFSHSFFKQPKAWKN